jgi:hypothetical protein
MGNKDMTKRDRQNFINNYLELSKEIADIDKNLDDNILLIEDSYFYNEEIVKKLNYEKSEIRKKLSNILLEYFENVEIISLSRCPICNEKLRHSFDKYGIDGFWWSESTRIKEILEPEHCKHFKLMQGAVNLNNLMPNGGIFRSLIGPEVPYVIPAILNNPDTYSVISSIKLEDGHIAYPIVYFSDKEISTGLGSGTWINYSYYLGNFEEEFISDKEEDKWDFNLRSWVQNGKLKWIEPNDNEFKISTKPLSQFPYYNIKGTKEIQILQGDNIWTIEPYFYKGKIKNKDIDEEFSTIV